MDLVNFCVVLLLSIPLAILFVSLTMKIVYGRDFSLRYLYGFWEIFSGILLFFIWNGFFCYLAFMQAPFLFLDHPTRGDFYKSILAAVYPQAPFRFLFYLGACVLWIIIAVIINKLKAKKQQRISSENAEQTMRDANSEEDEI